MPTLALSTSTSWRSRLVMRSSKRTRQGNAMLLRRVCVCVCVPVQCARARIPFLVVSIKYKVQSTLFLKWCTRHTVGVTVAYAVAVGERFDTKAGASTNPTFQKSPSCCCCKRFWSGAQPFEWMLWVRAKARASASCLCNFHTRTQMRRTVDDSKTDARLYGRLQIVWSSGAPSTVCRCIRIQTYETRQTSK